jgi:hypothetical protein
MRPINLIPDSLSHDTVECLQQLLDQAKQGQLVGIAFAGVIKRRGYIVDAAGEAHTNPTFARGMIAALDDRLALKARGNSHLR